MTTREFDQQVLESKVPVLVDFWAAWCAPCRTLGPVVDAFAAAQGDQWNVLKVTVDDHPELVERYDVGSVPTLVFFHGGKEVKRLSGVVSLEELTAHAADLLNLN